MGMIRVPILLFGVIYLYPPAALSMQLFLAEKRGVLWEPVIARQSIDCRGNPYPVVDAGGKIKD